MASTAITVLSSTAVTLMAADDLATRLAPSVLEQRQHILLWHVVSRIDVAGISTHDVNVDPRKLLGSLAIKNK